MTTNAPKRSIGDVAMAEIYYVESAKPYVGVADGKVFDIQRVNPRTKINPHAIVVEHLDATFEAIHAVDGVFIWTASRQPI